MAHVAVCSVHDKHGNGHITSSMQLGHIKKAGLFLTNPPTIVYTRKNVNSARSVWACGSLMFCVFAFVLVFVFVFGFGFCQVRALRVRTRENRPKLPLLRVFSTYL
jgi:hypothetical protein